MDTFSFPFQSSSLLHINSPALSYFVKAHLHLTPKDLHFVRTVNASLKSQMSDPNARYPNLSSPTHQARDSLPGTDWQFDFTHIPTVRWVRHLLVLADTFLGWVEAVPTTNKRALTVSDLQEIIPRLGIPTSLQQDNDPEFTSQIPKPYLKPSVLLGISISNTIPSPQER